MGLVVMLSALIGSFRGIFRETFSLLSWGVSAWISWSMPDLVAPYIQEYVSSVILMPLSIAIIFLAALALLTLVSRLIEGLITLTRLKTINRPVGMAFGLIRGGIIVIIILSIMMLSPFKNKSWLRHSWTFDTFREQSIYLVRHLPDYSEFI